MAKLHPTTIKILRMIRQGDWIVPGGGITIRPLPSGQIELSIADADIRGLDARNPNRNTDTDPLKPGKPYNPDAPPLVLPPIPPLPPLPEGTSGTYPGGSGRGRRITGRPTSPDAQDPPYNFNQRGWQWYQDNF